MQNKNDGNKNKMILGDLNCPMDKTNRDGKIKNKDFIDSVSIILCQRSLWIMDLRIYGEGRSQIVLSSLATIGPLAKIQDRKDLY